MTKEIEKMKLENRIALLLERHKENGNIVKKLRRRLRNLSK